MPPLLHIRDRSLRARLAGFALLALALGIGSCLGPTELMLHVHTNVPCTDPSQWKGVAVYVGAPGANIETKAPALTTTTCNQQGEVGSLVVVPSGSKDAEVGLRVVAGLDRHPDDCAAHHYQGCIVVRRTVRFNAHDSLDLDIALTSECVGFGCDATHTCVNGVCSIADADPSAPATDAEARVRCGDNGVFCPTSGDVCCLSVDKDAGTSFGECRPSEDCPPTSTVLNCDDESDCAGMVDDAGRTGLCIIAYTANGTGANAFQPNAVSLSACMTPSNLNGNYLEMCQNRKPCLNGKSVCMASDGLPQNPLPGYFWCIDDLFVN